MLLDVTMLLEPPIRGGQIFFRGFTTLERDITLVRKVTDSSSEIDNKIYHIGKYITKTCVLDA